MSNLSSFIDCPDILVNLGNYFGTNPQLYMEPNVLTNFLQSDMNVVDGMTTKVTTVVAPGMGKIRTLQLFYSPRMLESDVSEGTGREDCTSNNVVGETSALYTIDENEYLQHGITMNYFDLKRRCESNADYFSRILQELIDVVTRKRETMLYSELAALNGKFAVGETNVSGDVKSIATAYSNGTLNPQGMADIVTATRYAGYNGGPIVLGGREMGYYFNKINAGCCSIDGVDIDKLHAQYGYAYLESYRADDIFGVDNFFTVARGAAQLIEYSEFEGDAGNFNYIDTPQLKFMTIIDPRTGSKYDFKMTMDCNGNVSVFIRSWFKMVSLPSDAFFPGDRLYGVNWINQFEIDNPTP